MMDDLCKVCIQVFEYHSEQCALVTISEMSGYDHMLICGEDKHYAPVVYVTMHANVICMLA